METVVRGFSRYDKYMIGRQLRESCWQVVNLIVKANNTPLDERRALLVLLPVALRATRLAAEFDVVAG